MWDAAVPAFGARRQRSTAIAYVLLYRTREGRQRWHTIGRHGAPWTPDTAREEARRLLGDVVRGVDPAGDKKTARTAPTVSELCDAYLADAEAGRLLLRSGAGKKASTIYTDRRRVERHVKPLLGHLKVAAVTAEDVVSFMHQVATGASAGVHKTERGVSRTRGGKGTASRTVGLLGAVFAYAVHRKLRKDNPVRGVTRFKDGRRERRLTDMEYALLGAGLDAAVSPPPPKRPGVRPPTALWPPALAAIRFLVLTGWRRGEVLGLRWAEVELQQRVARLTDTKTGASVRPLSKAACDVLRDMSDRFPGTLVFPPSKEGATPGTFQWLFNRTMTASGIPADVTPHVLRHSFASLAGDLGYSEPTIAALIGHAGRTMTSRYVHTADAVLLAAADAVADWTLKLMSGKMEPSTTMPAQAQEAQ